MNECVWFRIYVYLSIYLPYIFILIQIETIILSTVAFWEVQIGQIRYFSFNTTDIRTNNLVIFFFLFYKLNIIWWSSQITNMDQLENRIFIFLFSVRLLRIKQRPLIPRFFNSGYRLSPSCRCGRHFYAAFNNLRLIQNLCV